MIQIDPQTGLEIPQQTTNIPMPSNLQGGKPQGFITPQQQATGKGMFGANPQEGLTNPPMFDINNNKYNNQQLT